MNSKKWRGKTEKELIINIKLYYKKFIFFGAVLVVFAFFGDAFFAAAFFGAAAFFFVTPDGFLAFAGDFDFFGEAFDADFFGAAAFLVAGFLVGAFFGAGAEVAVSVFSAAGVEVEVAAVEEFADFLVAGFFAFDPVAFFAFGFAAPVAFFFGADFDFFVSVGFLSPSRNEPDAPTPLVCLKAPV
jgi:hypothetical protein